MVDINEFLKVADVVARSMQLVVEHRIVFAQDLQDALHLRGCGPSDVPEFD
ncbi:hypothetical protein [Brevibacterium linens]|uniref:hypothetical protein n=1 Tax=Brevibacterium linens TaxID=1703 RepID=UPI001C60EA81|nr:hypothetical protein [Brevibacterium linens]